MKDRFFKIVLFLASFFILILTAGIVYALVGQSMKTFSETGFFKFIISDEWNPKTEEYGALSFISGTLITSVLALVFCILFSLPVALFNGEYFRGKKVSSFVSSVVDLLAGIPSIVYGLWGFYVVCPVLVKLGISTHGFGVLPASMVLAVMIIPYASSLSAEFISMVPNELKEAAYSLGATRLEVILRISLPAAGSGIFTSYILALGRALGETMAVTMLIGNTNNIPATIVDTGNTMASIIANQFGEADGLKLSSLTAIGLLLFLLTAVINFIAKYSMKVINNT
ncbi:MAG: phosphate ABC transporter permease subunit PstC [Flavobacteriaceae bacterium]|jgi:phosphate transport system permease protein|nr:phosphate ABC transporter permease subunit PstC [Flavobacteriaceae bacterium]